MIERYTVKFGPAAGWRGLLRFGVCAVPKGQVCAARSVQSIHAEKGQVMQVVIPPA
jgi:ABC-type amino acid transport system permease subunit